MKAIQWKMCNIDSFFLGYCCCCWWCVVKFQSELTEVCVCVPIGAFYLFGQCLPSANSALPAIRFGGKIFGKIFCLLSQSIHNCNFSVLWPHKLSKNGVISIVYITFCHFS